MLAPDDVVWAGMWLRGVGIGLREYARGRAVVHGSALAIDGMGVTICGAARVGKSTLAAHMCRNGWLFVSDALTVLEPNSRLLIPQEARIRLFDDSLDAIGISPQELTLDDGVTQKRRFVVPARAGAAGDIPLVLALVLEKGERFDVRRLGVAETIIALVKHAYLAPSLEPSLSNRLMPLAAALANSGVRAYTIQYPQQWQYLRETQSAIELLLQGLSLE